MANTDFDPDAYLAAPQTPAAPAADAAFDPDKYLASPQPRAGILQTAGMVGRQLVDAAVYHAPAAVAAALEGDDPYAERDWKDRWIEQSRAKAKERTAELGTGPTAIPLVGDRGDIAQLGPSFGASLPATVGGLGTGLATGAAGSLVGTPVAGSVAGWLAGMAAAGTIAYKGSTNQFVRDLRDNVDEERAKTGQKPISDEEFETKRKQLAPLINEYGLWEAVPEAASQALGLKVLTAPVTGAIGKIFGDNILKRFITKTATVFGTELGTETITQQGQHNVQQEAGMNKPNEHARSWTDPADLYESFKEVAPVTVLQTGLMGAGVKAGQFAHKLATRDAAATATPAPAPTQQADELRNILGEPPLEPGATAPAPGAAPTAAAPAEDQRSILGEEREEEARPDSEYYVTEAMRNLRATSRTANGVLDTSSTPGKEDQMTGVSAKHAATLAKENYEGVVRGIYDRLDEIPQDGPTMAAFIDGTAEAVNEGIVKPGSILRTNDTKIPAQTAAADLPAAHAQFSDEMAERLADPSADPVETAAWIEWRSNFIDHFWSDGVGKTSKALAAIPLMRAGLPLPNYPSNREYFSYSPKERVDPNGGGQAYLGPDWERFNAFYHTMVGKPEPQQRADIKAMLADETVPLKDIVKHPLVQRAMQDNRAAVATGSPENFADPAWREQRIYDFGGETVRGWDEAVARLTDHANAFSTAGPVQNDRHAVIVLGPPAAGKSTVSEPMARSMYAAIVDADEAKKVIPEYRNGLGTEAVHEESSELTRGVILNMMRAGTNIILPKVGHSYESIKGLVEVLKRAGYAVDIAHVAATPEISGRRNIARFLETGRLVDPEYITEVGDKPRDTAYMLKGETNDFIDIDTSKGFEIVEGSGPLADALRARRNVGWSPDAGRAGLPEGTGKEGQQPNLIGEPVPGMQAHRVTDADGRSVEVVPIVVEAASLRTSRDYGYDQDLQPRDRDRAASDAQIREITNKLDPERLGYSSEADRGSPIAGSDSMVESGNGRIIALRNVYDKNGPQAKAYRDWLRRQGVNVDAYQHPVLIRQRLTPLTPKERQAFTLAANQPATLAMSAPERAVSDARHIDSNMLGLIKSPDDIGSIANRAFFRRFLSMLPKSEHGTLADARGHLSAEGLTRVRNAILAKAYGDTGVLARIAESTNDEVKSISNALTAAAPEWAAMRADVQAGRVRADIDVTADLVQAVERTAEIRSRGEKLETFLAQQDAFDRLPAEVEGFMRMFYDPKGRRAASAQRITDALRFYAQEAAKVTAEKGLGLDLLPVAASDIQRVAIEREWQDVGQQGLPEPGRGIGDVAGGPQGGRQARGPGVGEGSQIAAQELDAGDPVEEAIRAQQPTLRDLLARAGVKPATEKTKAGDQFVFPGGERISMAELLRRRAAEPMRPRLEQRAADMGLFGDSAQQAELPVTPEQRAAADAAKLGQNIADADAAARAEALQNREQTPTIGATTEAGDGRSGIQQSAPAVPGRTQARRLAQAPASRPEELPLFGWGGSERPVRHADETVRPEPGSEGAPVHAEGPGVTKPPARSRGNRPGRTDSPAVKGRLEAEQKIAERSRSNYRITPDDQVGVGNARQKINGNIEAIRTLKAVQDENRFATPAEKAILVKYVGWGAFAQDMFATHKPEWQRERDAFRALVSDEEYNAAKASTLNAHFTSPDVIRGMWDAMAHLGFKGGQVIEPAAGIGHFIGLIPDKVAQKTAWTAVELDPLTGGIAKALYGGTDVGIHGFENLKRPSNYYDLAISNVPFGDYHISEKPYGSFPIHDFFFVKSLDKVRPGGVVAFITSRYTMDRVDPETRRLLGRTADLVGAIRLPGGKKGAFAGNAGTEVTTDIIFLRKKVPGEPAFPGANWAELKQIKTKDGPASINEYFAEHPEMMLGEMRLMGTMYRADEPVLVGSSEGLQERIAEAARNMEKGALLPMQSPAPPPISGDEIGTGIKDGSFFVQNGKLYQRRQGQGFEHQVNAEDQDRIARLVGIRGIVSDLLNTQLDAGDNSREQADHLRGKLREAYDAFVAKYGPINKEVRTVTERLDKEGEPIVITRHPNFHPFRKDPDAWKVASIEEYDGETDKAKRAAIQTKDVIDPPRERQINGPSDALSASLNDTAGVDLDHIAQSLNLDSHDAVVQALGDLVYQNPDGRQWETADQYLSGNVVKKLEDARALAQQDPSYLRNVANLEKVQPLPLMGSEITAQFGAPWIPAEVYQNFLTEIGLHRARVARVPITGEWSFDYGHASRDAQTKFGTDRVEVGKIVNAALNNKMVTVYDRGKDKDTVNDKATQEARVKTELLKEAFTGDMEHGIDGWVFGEPERAAELEGIYNRTYNNLAQRKFDGAHLSLPGLNPDFATRKHRLDAIWRIIQTGNTLLAHVVGSGKTVTMIAAGMEEKRLGLINKPAYVIPNHMLEQFSREFIQAYPNAKILVAQKDEMTRENRKEFLAKVAANDWDGVIITHDAFGRINMGHEFRKQFIQDQLDELERVMRAEVAASDKKSPTVKNLEKAKKKLEERLQNLMNEDRKDAGTSFEESGIDRLYVDEAHKFKNLQFITRLSNISGLAQGNSQRAEDLFLKIRYLEQKRPGRSAVFATGTPVSNTMAELWTMMRYLELDKLRERGLDTFDAWASTFGRVVNNMELSPDGRTFKEKSSFSKFVNIPELVALYAEVADTKTADMLNLPRPEVKTRSGAPGIEIVEATPSSQEEEHIESLVRLAESLKGKRPEKGQPNMLSVVTAGRKVATDGRLISPDFDFNPQGKIAMAVQNIARIWKEGNADPTAPNKVQMVFLDMGVPQSRSAKKRAPVEGEEAVGPAEDRIDLYADLKRRLVEQGVPANQIAAIHDAGDDIKKGKLFSRVRTGDVRVILGSSEKMGVGTNVQDLLIAMHHLDAPWKPADVEQRDGRIVRQGNKNKAVQIYRYVTKKSFDAFMWQKLDTKSKFIGQVLSGAKGSRHAEDIDNPLPEAAEMKAAASGDPRILEHAELDRIVRALSAQRRAYESTKSRASSEVGQAKSRIEMYEKALPSAKEDARAVQDITGDKFMVQLGDAGTIINRADAGKAILARLSGLVPQQFYTPKLFVIGQMSGFTMHMEVRGSWDGTQAILRATPSLKGKSGYGAINDYVINEHTDPAGLIRRYENILGSIRSKPETLESQLALEQESLGKLQKTQAGVWPREQEYRNALKKLDDLSKSMRAPEHPDVSEGKAAEEPATEGEVRAQVQRLPSKENVVGFDLFGPRHEPLKKRAIFGLPLNPLSALEQLKGESFCVSFGTRQKLGRQLDDAIRLVGKDGMLLVDNGAFTLHKQGQSTRDPAYLKAYEKWAQSILDRTPRAVAVIPDVIGGTEEQNAELVREWQLDPWRSMAIWHMHESLDHLKWLIESSPNHVGIGSSGEFWQTGTPQWHRRIHEALDTIASFEKQTGDPRPRIHMMRAQSQHHLYPFDSSDSTNLAVNHGRTRDTGEGHVRRFADRIKDNIEPTGTTDETGHQLKRPIEFTPHTDADLYALADWFNRNYDIVRANQPKEKIISAAIRVGGKIFPGVMHADAYEAATRELGPPDTWRASDLSDDGFITSSGRYVDRKEARIIADRNDQIAPMFKPFGPNLSAEALLGWSEDEAEIERNYAALAKATGSDRNEKEYLTVKGQPAWMVLVDPIDNAILHSVRYKHAADADFHHSHYLSRPLARMVNDGEAIMVWGDGKGIYAMESMSRAMRAAVMKLYDPAVKARVGWEEVESRELGPLPGDRVVTIGTGAKAFVRPSASYSAAEHELGNAVKEIARRMAPQANLKGVAAIRFHERTIWGAFVSNKAFPHLIAWSLEQGDAQKIAGTVRHEIVHHLREGGMFRRAEWQALSDAAVKNGWLDKHDIEARYPGLSREHKIEEAIAEQFSDWRKERSIEKPGLIRDAFIRMDLMLRRVAAAARKIMGAKATAADVFTRIETGEVGRRKMAGRDRMPLAAQAPGATEAPPPAHGMVRLFHGGHDYSGGKRWVTTDRKYAQQGYTTPRVTAPIRGTRYLQYVDVPAEGAYGKMPAGHSVNSFHAPEELAQQLRPFYSADVLAQAARATETPAFKKWFGDSKVVDKDGKPRVVYHGTDAEGGFSTFERTEDIGFHFGTVAHSNERVGTGVDSGQVMPAYLRIKEPLRLPDLGTWDPDDVLRALRDARILTKAEFENAPDIIDREFVRDALARKGHDGIVYLNMSEGGVPTEERGGFTRNEPYTSLRRRFPEAQDSYIVFDSAQIKSATGNAGTFDPADPDVRAQTPGREARERRQAAVAANNTIWQRVVQSSDKMRAAADAYADRIGVNEVIRGIQMSVVPMAARDATTESRLIAKEYANARRQSRNDWNNADKHIEKNFTPERRKAMWEAADEQSVAMQQGRPTAGIGLDRLPPNERAVVDMLQTRGQRNFAEAQSLKMVQTAGLPSYAPRMLVRMSTDNKAEAGAGAGSEIVRDIRTLALANARLEDAIAARKLINSIEDVGRRTGSATVNGGGAPTNRIGAEGVAIHALDQMGRGFSTTTPQLKHRKHLTAAETEAAANLVQNPDPDAPKWFTLTNPAFMKLEPRLRVNETTKRVEVVKDKDGNPIFDRQPIYVRSDFEGPLRSILGKGFDENKLYQALMSLKGKAMSVIMMSPLIHNQVEWGRALPAAPGKVLTFQTYLEGNVVANDPVQMRQAIAGGTAPIGGHGFMQDLTSIAEAPTVRPGRSLTAKGAGYVAEATGHITRLFNPRAGADEVRRAVDHLGTWWHDTLLWDRVRDLQMGLWKHINESLVHKGYDAYAANVAASHFANRYAGALPIESMSGAARGIANLLLFSRSFTLGNLGAYKDAALGLPRDAQAMIQHHSGWAELQKIQSFTKRKSRAMLGLDAGMYYITLSVLQSAFNTAGVVPTVATLGGMIAGGALGGKGGKYGRIAAAVGGGAAAFGLAAVLGASPGTKKLEDELMGYWDRFTELLHKFGEHPFSTLGGRLSLIENLSATADNEPGKKGRLLVGYQPDGSAIYARLAVGKVTEELLAWAGSPNEILHNKLSTFARPLNQIWSNDVGFGHKLYDPKAETLGGQAKNFFKIIANIVAAQVPIDTAKGAYEWFEGGPGSDVAGLKAIAPFIGTTISKGYPGGPELGVLNDARERARFDQNEWMPTIRKQIKNGETDKAIEKMTELGIAPGLQKYYVQTTLNPKARMTKRQVQDFMRYATPEQRKHFEAAQESSNSENRSTGGAAPARAQGGGVGGEETYSEWRERIGWADGGRVLARANGGRVDASNINHDPSEAQKHAGNYAKDHVNIFGLPLTIENAKGSVRRGVGPDGKAWACALPAHYGYVKRTHGQDDDHVDIYLGPHSKSPHVFLIDQHDHRTGKMDEHKAMLGFGSQKQALACYERAFSDGKGRARIGAVTTMTIPQFKEWLAKEAEKRTHASVDYVETSAKADHCAICVHFIPGNPPGCKGVKSPISPMGWCTRFKS